MFVYIRVCVSTHPAVAAQLVAMVHSFFLSEGQTFPPLVKVAESCINLSVIHTTLDGEEKK